MNDEGRGQRQVLVLAGVCPWCGRDGWKSIAKHTNAAHGIDRFTLREMCGLPWTASVCSPEISERRRQLNSASGRIEQLRALPRSSGPRAVSPAGRAVLARNGAAPKPRPGRRRVIGPEVRQRALDLRAQGRTYDQVAAELGIAGATAHRIVNGRPR